MDFGRLDSIDGVRFDLPELDPRSETVLASGSAPRGPGAVRIGAPAWSSRSLVKKVYPKGTRPGDYLARYAERFSAIELNGTFHRFPDARTVEAWRDATPETFRFCPKLHRAITERELDVDAARRFGEVVAHFGARLGPILLQLGPMFTPKRLPELERCLDAMAGRAVAVELRHRAWFDQGRLREDAFRALSARAATAVITDTAGRRDVCHGSLTSPTVFVRFQGNEMHPTDAERLDAWASRLAAWMERGTSAVYFFTHQPDDTLAPETIALLTERVQARCGASAVPLPLHVAPVVA